MARRPMTSSDKFGLNIVMAITVLFLFVLNPGVGLIALLVCAIIALRLGRQRT